MTLKEEIKVLEKLRFDEVREHSTISIRLKHNTETILKTLLTIENAVLLFGNYEVKLVQITTFSGNPVIEFVCIVPECEQIQEEV